MLLFSESLSLLIFAALFLFIFAAFLQCSDWDGNNHPMASFFAAVIVLVILGLFLLVVGWCLEHGAWLIEWLGYYMKLLPTAAWRAFRKIFG